MTYYIGLVLIVIIFGMILFASYGKKKNKNGVFQTITKTDMKKNKITVKTDIFVDNKLFDTFEETIQGVEDALDAKKEAKKKGDMRYKRAKELMKK